MQERSFTVEDIMNLPEGVRMEVIDGNVYDMATPSPWHQQICVYFVRKIADHIDKKNGDCLVIPAPFGVFFQEDNNTYVEPDISVICDKNKISERGCEGAPDWIVDPVSQYVTVYDFEADIMKRYTFSDIIPVSIYDDLEIDMSKL